MAPAHAATPPITRLAVGQCLTYSVAQTNPGSSSIPPSAFPNALVTITVCRPDATHLTVTADAPTVNEDACTLGLGGTFNVQVVLTPTPAVITGSSYVVLQTTDASSGAGVPDYDAVYPSTPFDSYGPLSAMGISATYTDAWCNEPDDGTTVGFGTSTEAPGHGFVSYSIPFGSGPSGPAGPYSKVKFLCTSPFGYDFLAPCSVTVVPGVACPHSGDNMNTKQQQHEELCEHKADHGENEDNQAESEDSQTEQSQQNSDLSNEDLSNADFSGFDFSNSNVRYADLSGSILQGVNLAGADLTCASFGGADLTGANLAGAILDGADLTGATLLGVDLTSTITSIGFTGCA